MHLKAQNASINIRKFSVRKHGIAGTAVSVGTQHPFWIILLTRLHLAVQYFPHLHEKNCNENILEKVHSHHHKHWDYRLRNPVNPRRISDTSYFLTKMDC